MWLDTWGRRGKGAEQLGETKSKQEGPNTGLLWQLQRPSAWLKGHKQYKGFSGLFVFLSHVDPNPQGELFYCQQVSSDHNLKHTN